MIRRSFRAMGTSIDVVSHNERGANATEQLFARVEARCSRFLSGSELSTINRRRSRYITVSPLMARILQTANLLRERSGGLVDPGIGGDVVRWGYDRTFDDIADVAVPPSPQGTLNEGARPRLELDGSRLRLEPETRLDLGGIAKGWTCDLAVEAGMASIVNAGGDVRSSHPHALVEILDPWSNNVATLPLPHGGLATSSVTRRNWRVGERIAHHLIDPRTAQPADSPVLSASVRAATAVEAEAGAKAFLIRGSEGLAWADEQEWLQGALVVWNDGSVFATTMMEAAA